MSLEQRRYFGGFASVEDVRREFAEYRYDDDGNRVEEPLPEPFPTDAEVLFAAYGTEQAYQGEAEVLFVRDGKLYEAGGSHCSCNGLEGQWTPSPVTWAALRLRGGLEGDASGEPWRRNYFEYDDATHEAWDALVAAGVDP